MKRIALLIAVAGLGLAPRAAGPAVAAEARSKTAFRFELTDGSVITGTLADETFAVRTLCGAMKLPATKVRQVKPAVAPPVVKATTSGNEATAVILSLRDGSRYRGELDLAALPLVTPYGKLGVRPRLVRTVTFVEKSGKGEKWLSARLDLRNGDKLHGSISLKTLTLDTPYGRISVPIAEVLSMDVSPAPRQGPGARTGLSASLKEGLLLHYDFEDPIKAEASVLDRSGHKVNAKAFGSPRQVEGIAGKAIEFNGKNYLRVNSNPTKRLDRLSVSLWFKTADPKQNYKLVTTAVWYRGPGSGWTVGTHYPEFWDVERKGIRTGGTQRKVPFVPGKWNHLVVVYDGRSVCEYVNGRLSRKYSATGKKIGDGGRFEIGAWHPYTAYNYKGAMDELRIYNRALSLDQIKLLYHRRQ